MKTINKKNLQDVKQKSGYVRTALPLLLFVMLVIILGVLVEMIFEKDTYRAGQVNGTNYESEMLGIEFNAPQGFKMASQEQLDEQLKESTSFSNAIKNETESRTEMAAISEKETAFSIMTWEKESSHTSIEQYLKTSKDTIMKQYASRVEFTNDGEISSKEIAGDTYDCLKLDFTADKTERCSEFYMREIDDYVVLIGISYNKDEKAEKDMLFEAIQPLKK